MEFSKYIYFLIKFYYIYLSLSILILILSSKFFVYSYFAILFFTVLNLFRNIQEMVLIFNSYSVFKKMISLISNRWHWRSIPLYFYPFPTVYSLCQYLFHPQHSGDGANFFIFILSPSLPCYLPPLFLSSFTYKILNLFIYLFI